MAQQQLSINVLYMLFESLTLHIDIGQVFSEVGSLAVIYGLSLLYCGGKACDKCP